MNPTRKILLVTAAVISIGFSVLSQEPDTARHWYWFQFEGRMPMAGTSPLTPEALAKRLGGAEFIRLDSALSLDGTGKWDSVAMSREVVFIRPQSVQSFVPLAESPKTAAQNPPK